MQGAALGRFMFDRPPILAGFRLPWYSIEPPWTGSLERKPTVAHVSAGSSAQPEGVERKLAAIVAADVVGYWRLMAVDETGTQAA